MAWLAKKPHAKNALDVFSEENKDAITEKTRHLAENEGSKAPGETLNAWKQARQVMFNALDPDTKARYESQAAKLNERLNSPPDVREIYAYVIFELLWRTDICVKNLSSTVTKWTSYWRSQGH